MKGLKPHKGSTADKILEDSKEITGRKDLNYVMVEYTYIIPGLAGEDDTLFKRSFRAKGFDETEFE